MSATSASPSTTTAQPSTLITSQTLPVTHDTYFAFPSTLQTGTSGVSAPSNQNGSSDGGPVSYYFVFFALILCVIAFAGFIFWRRRRILAGRPRRSHMSMARTGFAAPTQRASAMGIWRSAEVSREEGLNEQGEAPPPYVAKAFEEPGQRHEVNGTGSEQIAAQSPAIPMQALTRESAGLVPPYSADSQTDSMNHYGSEHHRHTP